MNEYITPNPSIPRVDLHCHLEGSIQLTKTRKVGRKITQECLEDSDKEGFDYLDEENISYLRRTVK